MEVRGQKQLSILALSLKTSDKFVQASLCVHIIFLHTCAQTIATVLNQDVSVTVYADYLS